MDLPTIFLFFLSENVFDFLKKSLTIPLINRIPHGGGVVVGEWGGGVGALMPAPSLNDSQFQTILPYHRTFPQIYLAI